MKKLLCLCLALLLYCGCGLAETYPDLVLNTTDLEGNPVTNELIAGASVVVVNFWEPWCGPCVSEMPALQKLSEDYAGQGLMVVGVYSTFSMDEDAKEIVAANGVTYPILRYTSDMAAYASGYVPTSILVDGEGRLLCDELLIGGMTYESWVDAVKPYLNGAGTSSASVWDIVVSGIEGETAP